jgi:hypothetical protein
MIGDLASMLVGGTARALVRELGRAKRPLRVIALDAGLQKALTAAGHSVEIVALDDDRLSLASDGADAACLTALDAERAPALLAECSRCVADGGAVLVATPPRGHQRPLVAALLMHAGLVDIEQRATFTSVLTAARVRR